MMNHFNRYLYLFIFEILFKPYYVILSILNKILLKIILENHTHERQNIVLDFF